MKRSSFIILILALAPVCVSAGDVSVKKASVLAGSFLGTDASSLTVESQAMKSPGRGSSSGQPAYYIFNNPNGGWVIVSADDRVVPILGYSSTGSFQTDDMPENVRYWMDGIADVIGNVRSADIQASQKVRNMWTELQNGKRNTKSGQVILETAKWGQSYPFNILCPVPVDGSQQAITGCVATAMAIAMHYNKWPVHGTGTVGGYRAGTSEQYYPAYSIDDHEYDWKSMDDLTSEYSKNQVGTLLLDCGMSVEMDYQKEGSGAYSFEVAQAMRSHFGYPFAQHVSRATFQDDEWFSIVRKEIDANRVVIYGGNTLSTGHEFLCDGYDGNEKTLHINWGWNGKNDGFYALDLTISSIQISFEYNQEIVIGLAAGGSEVLPADLQPISMKDPGILLDASSFLSKDGNVLFETGNLTNTYDKTCSASVKACLMRSGKVLQEIGTPGQILLDPYNSMKLVFADRLQVQPEITDYFQLFITAPNGDWVPLTYNTSYCPSGEYVCCGMTADPLILIDDLQVKDVIELKLGYGSVPVRQVTWYVNGKKSDAKTLTVQPGRTEIRADLEYCDDTTGSITKTLVVE